MARLARARGDRPLDFLARLAALVPKLRVHLTRYHGVFAPHSRWRAEITPARRGPQAEPGKSSAERHRALSWAQRLKRVFRMDIATCERCGGALQVIASIEDPAVAARILAHLEQRPPHPSTAPQPQRVRAPPPGVLDLD